MNPRTEPGILKTPPGRTGRTAELTEVGVGAGVASQALSSKGTPPVTTRWSDCLRGSGQDAPNPVL